ncbi:MAG: acyl-CoA desaturase [Streptosporangiales bacterium]|nr:acyl-CoA desaturase [Streptosporangiales bacterium]
MTIEAALAPPTTNSGSTFPPLRRRMQESGLLERRYGYYAGMIGVNLLCIGAIAAAMVVIGPSWWQLLLALPAAIFTGRTAFVGHDSGHQQIARSHRVNKLIGLIHGNMLMGMSYGWWNNKHNRHHANPNHGEKDPDVQSGALVWSKEQAGERLGGGAMNWLARHQAYLFFPMLLLEGFNLKVSSIRAMRDRSPSERIVEGTLLAVHLAGYVTFLLLVMSPLQALVFALVHNMLFGLHLGMAFAPNHKGMPAPQPGQRWDHLHRQVLTSRNVRGGVLTDWFLGGLNYQIEHHLFPSMPRANLGKAVPIVRDYCKEIGVPYVDASIVGSYREALRHLHEVGEPLRLDL